MTTSIETAKKRYSQELASYTLEQWNHARRSQSSPETPRNAAQNDDDLGEAPHAPSGEPKEGPDETTATARGVKAIESHTTQSHRYFHLPSRRFR
ncbi:hypothetical protein BD410DRAFT_781344 [Rickenella mellea]|uniref:Uncharacterized protein n=1 Tax=Rickenella mellea TaxID=50990 RepID=A0A4Y7QMD2_9AGAM|nr:hypothetical protein BD410DRAFT_781344 [Rickenella mellea]